MKARTWRVNSSGEIPSNRLTSAIAMRSRPSSPILALSFDSNAANSGAGDSIIRGG